MSERMVIVVEYEADLNTQQALNAAMTQVMAGADRLDPELIQAVGVHVGTEDFVDRVLAVFAKDASAPSKAPSSPVETTEPVSGTESHVGSSHAHSDPARFNTYLDAIYGVGCGIDSEHWVKFSTRRRIAEACMALADAKLAERDATIDRLWAQLNEATNVPDAPTTNLVATGSKLVVGHGAVGNTPMCRVHPEHFMPCSRCLGYGCTACDNAAKP